MLCGVLLLLDVRMWIVEVEALRVEGSECGSVVCWRGVWRIHNRAKTPSIYVAPSA